jgi:TatD DNase family protein
MLRLYDAHNHLQDERLAADVQRLLHAAAKEGVTKMVVNGSCEEDWPAVLALAEKYATVIPSFGYHPWYVKERTSQWKTTLVGFLEKRPSAIGEIGLDKWIKDYDLPQQEEVFIYQLRLAAERNLPVSIHCLQAWGRLLEILQKEPRPTCGFVLHSYGGPREMIPPLTKLGAYFSLPGYFAHERKLRQRETFTFVPPDRLLIETDAPDQLLPEDRTRHALLDPKTNQPVNHPANLIAVYEFAAELRGESLEKLASQVEENFKMLFGRIAS